RCLMSSSAVPISTPGQIGLHTRRCVRHPSREAAARCPSCQEFFCRECVVEHEGKLLCAACLARLVAPKQERSRQWAKARQSLAVLAGLLVLWFTFQELGTVLMRAT